MITKSPEVYLLNIAKNKSVRSQDSQTDLIFFTGKTQWKGILQELQSHNFEFQIVLSLQYTSSCHKFKLYPTTDLQNKQEVHIILYKNCHGKQQNKKPSRRNQKTSEAVVKYIRIYTCKRYPNLLLQKYFPKITEQPVVQLAIPY